MPFDVQPLRVSPAACAAVDDGVAGVEAARAAGYGLVVGVERSGGGPQRELLERRCDVVVADAGELAVRAVLSRRPGR